VQSAALRNSCAANKLVARGEITLWAALFDGSTKLGATGIELHFETFLMTIIFKPALKAAVAFNQEVVVLH